MPIELKELLHNLRDRDWNVNPVYKMDENEGKKLIEAIEAVNKWIPVSERMPKNNEDVLVCYEDGHVETAYYYIDTDIYPSEYEDCCETGWYNYNEDFMYNQDVIAWMPLPASFEPQESEGV